MSRRPSKVFRNVVGANRALQRILVIIFELRVIARYAEASQRAAEAGAEPARRPSFQAHRVERDAKFSSVRIAERIVASRQAACDAIDRLPCS